MREQFIKLPLHKNEEKKCFEMQVAGSLAFIEYKEMSGQIALVHTEVAPALNGQGIASALVEKTLEYIEDQNKKLLPFCPYVFAYIKKHPECKRIVDTRFKGYDKL